MGVETRRPNNRRPPLPAPTESMDEQSGVETEVGTNVTTRTDKSSYSVPDDGSPITISTQKITSGKSGSLAHHGRQKSQTSLLIEYFEASKSGDKSRNRPSVRVKVTPSSTKKARGGSSSGSSHDAIQITGIGKDRKPSYTRRISLGSKSIEAGAEGTELSHSSESNLSQRPPVEIEVLNYSDVSNHRSSRGLVYAPVESNVSSMPPDSMLEGELGAESELSHNIDRGDDATPRDDEYLKAPVRTRSRSDSRERITQRVMEKLGAAPTKTRKSNRSSQDRSIEGDFESNSRERRRRSSKSQRYEEGAGSGAESSLVSSNPTASHRSYRSDRSQASRMTNNPKLLEMVEDTIKRVILPEINAIKEDRRTDRNLRTFEQTRHGSDTPASYDSGNLERRVSKSSSSPNIVSKPKVVLNRDGDDPGTVLSRGDSERIKPFKSGRNHGEDMASNRWASNANSRGIDDDDVEDDERERHRRSGKENHSTRDVAATAAAATLAGGALTAAALRSHDSRDDVHERRKRRSKSRSSHSRSVSRNDTNGDAYALKELIPPMPLASQINDSEVTRESILSQGTEISPSVGFHGTHTPIREVSRGSLGETKSPASSRTPTRTSQTRGLGTATKNPFTESPRSSNGGLSNQSRIAALAATGLGASLLSGEEYMDDDGYGAVPLPHKSNSPVQSVSSLKKNFEDDESLVPQGLRPRSVAARSSAARLRGKTTSQTSLQSAGSSPATKLARSRMHSRTDSVDEYTTPQERRDPDFVREGSGTPSHENIEEWLEREHQVNDRYRDSLDEPANRDSYQTNPYPQDEKRFTQFTDDSLDQRSLEDDMDGERDVQTVNKSLNPNFIHTPVAVESAVASLIGPSTVSSAVMSSNDSASKNRGSYSDRIAEQQRNVEKDDIPGVYEGSTLSQNMPSQDRWAAIKGYARAMSNNSAENVHSPRQSPAKSTRDMGSIAEHPIMSASGLPLADDPMPEIGHFDDSKSLTTNPSIIQGPLGGDATGNQTWPYTPEPQRLSRDSGQTNHEQKDDALLTAGAAAVGGAAAASIRQPTIEDEQEKASTPDVRSNGNRAPSRDADTMTNPQASVHQRDAPDGPDRSDGALTPRAKQRSYGKKDLDDYHRAMNAQDPADDPFAANPRHMRTLSGNSHGMNSPLYDSATGNGIDRIQSKDIVALMDHLTVRDAQRNARDTEILVTLVRSAAEMRHSFDEIKRFIVEQDKMIMQGVDRGAETTAQRVLGGPRPPPTSSPRTPRRELQSDEDIQSKRKGVLRRALKGLTGGKSARDLARIEDMLMQVLDNVEDLKQQGGQSRAMPPSSYSNETLDSYERLRAGPDEAHQPARQIGTAGIPNQPGPFPTTPREKQQFHSGYDGRRGSEHRVSTVAEDDEDEDDVLQPHESAVLDHQFENNERLLTPTQEYSARARGLGSPAGTPPQHGPRSNERTPKPTEKERKHKSTSSSIFGMSVPKVSRWSKTTASSGGPDYNATGSPTNARHVKTSSEASRSNSALGRYDDQDEQYDLHYDDRLPSNPSLARERVRNAAETRSMRSQASRLTRTPSPLIPSEASQRDPYDDDDPAASPVQEDLEDDHEFDDPKYQAVRNSLLLQHPQPRQGPTGRHQNTLETHAQTFEDTVVGSNSDVSQRTVSDFDPAVWGSSGTAGLARHRLTQFEPLSPVSMNSPGGGGYGQSRNSGTRDDDPLVPQSKPGKSHYSSTYASDWEEPQFSNSGFSKGGSSSSYDAGNQYSSPYGSGHLLEPIEEVRYSLETDRSNASPEPQVARAVAARKITGPRPMGSRSSSAASGMHGNHARLIDMTSGNGTVRRKPVPHSGASDGSAADSETF